MQDTLREAQWRRRQTPSDDRSRHLRGQGDAVASQIRGNLATHWARLGEIRQQIAERKGQRQELAAGIPDYRAAVERLEKDLAVLRRLDRERGRR